MLSNSFAIRRGGAAVEAVFAAPLVMLMFIAALGLFLAFTAQLQLEHAARRIAARLASADFRACSDEELRAMARSWAPDADCRVSTRSLIRWNAMARDRSVSEATVLELSLERHPLRPFLGLPAIHPRSTAWALRLR